eukprot:6081853-Heterocapsa_arctica.AAC.1
MQPSAITLWWVGAARMWLCSGMLPGSFPYPKRCPTLGDCDVFASSSPQGPWPGCVPTCETGCRRRQYPFS